MQDTIEELAEPYADKYWQADIKYSPHQHALYEAIIVRKNKTVSATGRITKQGLDTQPKFTFREWQNPTKTVEHVPAEDPTVIEEQQYVLSGGFAADEDRS